MEVETVLMLIGGMTVLLVGVFVCNLLREGISDLIDNLRWNYRYKHRFDKPPTALCYCKDCKHFKDYGSVCRCTRGHIKEHWSVIDSYFCWQAEPWKRDPEN